METLNHKAFFWKEFDTNEKPSNPRECQIVFTPKDGGKLLYFLDVNERLIYNDVNDKKIKVLYGQVSGGKKFTLYTLKFESAKPHFSTNLEITEVEYSIEYIFYDGWVDIENKIQIMHVRYSYLELWFNQLEIKEEFDDNERTMAGIMIHKDFLKCSTSKYNVLFGIQNGFSRSSFNNKVVTYETTNSLTIANKDDLVIDDILSLSKTVKSFFELMTFYSENKIFIEKCHISQTRKLKDGYAVDEIVYLLFKQDDYVDEQKMSHIDFLLRYKDIKDDFVQILNNWIENHKKNENEYNAFCNVISDKNTKFNIYTHYFQLVSALEGYYNNNFEEDIEFRKKLNQLIIKSEIKKLLPLNSSIHQSISNTVYNMRNDLAHSKKVIEINNRVKSSFEYIKIVALLLMMKDISLNHTQISKHILDYDLNSIIQDLESTFSKT